MAKIALLGHGVVGTGVVEVICNNHVGIKKRAGQEIEIKRILDLRDFPELSYKDKFTKNFDDIINDGEIEVVVEVMGGVEPAFSFVSRALNAKKSVVTSNKELVATKGAELLRLAKENNVNFFFEASVGGGIPIIRPMHQCLAANEIDEIAGILNGTTNFILTKMIKDGTAFDEALKIAQELGYAEREPSADVDGHDACRKICILASLAFGKHIYPKYVMTQGIRDITLSDVCFANVYGGVIKLIARAKRLDNGMISCMVTPAIVKNGSQLASIDDVFNGVLIRGNATGDVVFYGKGAGKLPTASAVVADVIDAIKSNGTQNSLTWSECNENIVKDYKTTTAEFFINVDNASREKIESLFGEVSYVHCEKCKGIGFVTKEMLEAKVIELESKIDIISKIRIVNY